MVQCLFSSILLKIYFFFTFITRKPSTTNIFNKKIINKTSLFILLLLYIMTLLKLFYLVSMVSIFLLLQTLGQPTLMIFLSPFSDFCLTISLKKLISKPGA